jgi:hypothetical protein
MMWVRGSLGLRDSGKGLRSSGKGKTTKAGSEFNSGLCFLCGALIILVLIYGAMTWHIIRRGHASRREGHLEGNLATHPHLQHHDLSSLFLEGLPPKRKKAADSDISHSRTHKSEATHNDIVNDVIPFHREDQLGEEGIPTEPGTVEEHVRAAVSATPMRKKTAEQEEFDPAEAVRYLRQRMPEV